MRFVQMERYMVFTHVPDIYRKRQAPPIVYRVSCAVDQ